MGSLLERWERQATPLKRPARGEHVITDYNVMRDVQRIAGEEQRYWRGMDQELRAGGDPMALVGGFTGLEVTPPVATLATATINSSTVDVALWPTATWTPIAANPQCPKAYRLAAFGIATTPATQGTISLQPRFGVLQTSPSLGLSTTAAPTASETATPWRIEGDVIIRAGGGATTGLVVASFTYAQGSAVSGGSSVVAVLNQIFGTTTGAVSVVTDGSVAAGLWMGGLAVTSTTNTFITHGVIWSSWN